jgi:hypothetical protein
MKLEMLLKTISDWYEWVATLNHQVHKVNWAIERTRGNSRKERTPQRKYYFSQKERDPNAMDIDRLMIKEQNKLMKEGRCFKCRNMGHRANNALKMTTRRRKARKYLKRRWTEGSSMLMYRPYLRKWLRKILKGAKEAGF